MTNCKETDVLVIGNGPSAISLSFVLSGWTPYYQRQGVSDEDLLHMRLTYQIGDRKIALTEMDLRELSDGLEGRTNNPVALVFDQLCHPDADIGGNVPSQLCWEKESHRAVSHLVIGRESKVGGIWQSIQGDLKTLSKSSWMELPDFPFKKFMRQQRGRGDTDVASGPGERATVKQVTQYYEEYVKVKGLSSNFMNECLVTSVEKVPVSPQLVNEDTGEEEGAVKDYIWEVKVQKLGEEIVSPESQFCVRAKHIVLATGASDVPNTMDVPGEDIYQFVKHGVSSVYDSLGGFVTDDSVPVLVIGAGLSAADAILSAHKHGMNVVHVFRETPCGNPSQMLKNLPRAVYPEYVQMYELMCGDVQQDWYKSYPQCRVHSFLQNNKVILSDENGDTEILEVAVALVQIGSRPNLSFLPSQGVMLGLEKGVNIDSKHNTLDVNPFTYESLVESELYALGPLVGDNFVRFLKGGAIAIAQDIQRKRGIIGKSV